MLLGLKNMITKIFKLKQEGKKIGFTASTFDILHAGHCAMLAEAKMNCDFLVVGLLTDPTNDRPTKNKPVQSTFERWVQVASITYVDMIIPFDTEKDLEDMIKVIQPDIRFVGEEYRGTAFTGKGIKDVEIYFNKREHSFSTSELRERVLKAGNVKPSVMGMHPKMEE